MSAPRGIAAFWHDRRGVAAIEFAMLAPVLALLLFGAVTLFVALRTSQDAEKATFVVADILSRRTTVDKAFLDTLDALFDKLMVTQTDTSAIVIRSFKRANNTFTVDWSYPANASAAAVTDSDMPLVANGDSVVRIDTTVTFTPISVFGGIATRTLVNTAANRPRFTAAIARTN